MLLKDYFKKFESRKIKKSDKIMLISHSDMDGSGPVIALSTIFSNFNFIHVSNEKMDEKIKEIAINEEMNNNYDFIFICDISCSLETAKIIEESNVSRKIILLDHHITAKYLNDFSFALVTSEKAEDSFDATFVQKGRNSSGTTLMVDFLLYKNLLPTSKFPNLFILSYMIGAYDTWDWKNYFNACPSFATLAQLFEILGAEEFENRFIFRILLDENNIIFTKEDKLFLKIDDEKKKLYCDSKSKRFIELNETINGREYAILFVTAENYIPFVFEKMQELYPTMDMYVIDTGTGYSFRTRKDGVDVSAIAKIAGGGGHIQASGCSYQPIERITLFKKILKID